MDQWPAFQTLTFKEFPFAVDRYEEYIGGKLVTQKNVNLNIKFKQHSNGAFTNGGLITVDLINNPISDKICSSFEFDRCITMGDRLMFYIYAQTSNIHDVSLDMVGAMLGYTRSCKNYEANEPIIANVFTVNQQVAKVAFKLVNPDRLIEFY